MYPSDFRSALLTTSSALALAVGLGGTAWAQCAQVNQAGGVDNTGAINCITYNNEKGGTANGNFSGATAFTGNVINSGTITPTGINQNWPAGLAGTDAGISVIGPGVTLTGNITNSGTITGTNSQFAGINIGGGGGGSGAPGATVVGSITNAASITGIQQGILVSGVGTVVTGSVINAAGASIINSPTAGGPGLSVTNHASVAGSLINSGTINTGGSGLVLSNATVGGDVSNGGMITIHNGFTAMALVNGGSVGGSVINTGRIVNLNATTNIALWMQGQTIAGGITNTGSITGGFGVYFSPLSNAVGATAGGNVSNNGTIVATSQTGIGIHGATVRGSVINSNSITATAGGGIVLGTTSGVSAKGSVAGGITNSGTITAKTGIAVVNGAVLSGGITNAGMISASGTGILLTVPGLNVFDSGTIVGGGGTAIQFGGGTNTLTLGPGWSITGKVIGAGSDNFQLGGSGTGTFNLGMLGTQFTGFTNFSVTGASWAVTGTNASNWSISSGAILQLGNGAASGVITGNLADSGVLTLNEPGGTTTTVPGAISGAGSLTQIGPGTVVLSGNNAYSGGTTLSAGTLQVTNGSAVGTGAVTLDGGAFQSGAAGLTVANKFALNNTGGTIDTQANILTLSGGIANGNGTTGALNKIGSGTLILTAASSYTGPTNVNAGTLQVTNASAAGTGTVTLNGSIFQSGAAGLTVGNKFAINNSGGTIDTQANILTLSSGIANGNGTTGALNKIGSGTLILTGASSYTGATNVNAGTLQAGANNLFAPASIFTVASGAVLAFNNFNETLGSLAGAGGVTLGSGLLTLTNASGVFSGTITGSGGFTLQSGTETLTGASSYTGPTTISTGTLQVANGSAVGTGTVTLDGGTFQSGAAGLTVGNKFALNNTGGTIDTQANILTLSGGIANGNGTTGALNKIGSGTLILTGASSYTGPTNVNAGTLQAGANNVFAPASIFTVASGAVLAFNNFNETLGSLAGAGSVTLGTGMLSLANASGVFSGTITGNGTFTLQTGTETLTGNDSGFTGTAVLSGGNFIVGTASSPGAIFGGSVTVQNGGTLSGHGTILGGINNAGGTVSPGGSIGTLSVGGNYTQGANGILAIQLTPAAASLLAVQGSASLAGTLEAMPSAGAYAPNAKYPILTAGGGVSGTFSTFIDTLPSLNLTISYLSNEVDLVVRGFAGQTRNQIAVANALNLNLGTATGDFATALTAIGALQPSQLPQTLASLGGQIYANLGEVSLQDRRLFLGAMDERMRLLGGGSPGAATLGSLLPGGWGSNANATQMAALGRAIGDQGPQVAQASSGAPGSSALPSNVWARGFGQFGSLDSNKGALGADYSTGGGAVGAEIVRTPGSLLGLAVSGGQSSVSTKSLPENGTISFVQFGAYGAQAFDYGLAADGAAIYAHDFYDVSRGLVGLGRTATSSHGGDDAVVDIGVSRPMQVDAWRITPRVGLSYFHIGQSSFAENGANSLDLSVSPAAIDALRSRVGVAVSQPMMLGDNQILPELRAAWTHDFLDDRGAIGAAFAGAPGLGFTQIGAATGRDAADLGVGVSFAVAQTAVPGQLSAFLQYDATVAAHQTNNAVAAGLKLTW